MYSRLVGSIALLVCLSVAGPVAALKDWPEFRGPTGQGLAEEATPPLTWGADTNIVWKQAIPGAGWSSPALYEDGLYVTTAMEDGEGHLASLRVLCVDGESGAIRWDQEVFTGEGRVPKHPKNGYASPTPIVAEGRVYVHFGPMGTACLDTGGTVVWRNTVAYETPHGNGGSPVLCDGKLIFSCDATDAPFVIALDQRTGAVVWKTTRTTDAGKKFSFSTPLIVEDGGQKLAVSAGSGFVGAFRVADGAEVWRVDYGEGFSVVPRPVCFKNLIYVTTGFVNPCTIYAIRMGGQGDVTQSHVAWTSETGTPNTPSMLIIGDELYYISDRGDFSCVDAATGTVHWQESLEGKFSASLVYADGRIYATSEDGTTTVVNGGKTFTVLAENKLEERSFASLALSGPALFLRTEHSLYRIQAP